MYPELTNLLPEAKQRASRRGYFMRLAVVGVFLACGIIIAHAILLVPTYLYVVRDGVRAEQELRALASSVQSEEEKEVNARLKALNDNVAYLARLKDVPTASAAIRAVLAAPRRGITLTGFTFTPGKTNASKMTLTGRASSRDALREFNTTLAALPFVQSADLPISAYAKDTDIPFTITLTGALIP